MQRCRWTASIFSTRTRNDSDSLTPYMPITKTRDSDINDFAVKSLSAKVLFGHIGNNIEHSRQFVRRPNFVGPISAGESRRLMVTSAVNPKRRRSCGARTRKCREMKRTLSLILTAGWRTNAGPNRQ